MLDFLVRLQGQIHATLTADLAAFAANRNWWDLAAVLPLGILFGAVHALTPGHGKAVLTSYLLGSGLASARAVLVAILLAVTHIGSAVVLALLAAPLVTRTLIGVGRAPSLEMISRGILVAIGLWLILRAFRRRPHNHGEGLAFSLAAGLIPCPLTLFVMFYALARGVPEAGIVFAAAMFVGVALTLAFVALIAVFTRDRLLALIARSGVSMDWISRILDGLAGTAVIVIAAQELLR